MPASRAWRSWPSAIAVLVPKPTSSGTPALARRAGSAALRHPGLGPPRRIRGPPAPRPWPAAPDPRPSGTPALARRAGSAALRHPGLGPPRRIRGPGLRQVEPPGDRQAGPVVGHRQAHRHLAILLLAQLPAVLPRHPD